MTTYALTYPQLMRQVLRLGWADADVAAVGRCHDAAARMTAGIQRPSGAGFLGHLVRTASIALRIQPDAATACAGLLHATYSLGGVGGWRAWLTRRPARPALRGLAGTEVEETIYAYHTLDWKNAIATGRFLGAAASTPPTLHRAVVVRLANELEDLLDGAMCFRASGFGPERATFSRRCAALADDWNLPLLARPIEEAVAASEAEPVDEALRTGRDLAYRPAWKRLPEAHGLRTMLRGLRRRH